MDRGGGGCRSARDRCRELLRRLAGSGDRERTGPRVDLPGDLPAGWETGSTSLGWMEARLRGALPGDLMLSSTSGLMLSCGLFS